MTSSRFAKRMGVSQARASAIESGEIEDSLTIKTLREAARALNCNLAYFLIPEKTLEETAAKQAAEFVKANGRQVAHSMGLENQSATAEDSEDFVKLRAEEILLKNINRIWELPE
jgi:predicted DNA-binding mobile mystery protein A